ncbi:topoisomerase DNA-binding C4 zinc finger domain-containing protein [Sporosarcina contaminans]
MDFIGSEICRQADQYRQTVKAGQSVISTTIKTCPKCAGTLHLKTGRYGKFYGCSGFPACRYTERFN